MTAGKRRRRFTTQVLEKSSTGISGLDDITGGGLPKGRPTLVCGGAGCGKTLLAMEFLVRGALQYQEPGVFMAFEEQPAELTTNMAANRRIRSTLLGGLEALRMRLEEAEETLHTIRSGEVDALLVSGPHGEQIFSLQGAEHPYRVLIEQMSDGAATLTTDGMLLYSNRRLAEMLHRPLEQVMGSAFQRFVASSAQATFEALLRQAAAESARGKSPSWPPMAR